VAKTKKGLKLVLHPREHNLWGKRVRTGSKGDWARGSIPKHRGRNRGGLCSNFRKEAGSSLNKELNRSESGGRG